MEIETNILELCVKEGCKKAFEVNKLYCNGDNWIPLDGERSDEYQWSLKAFASEVIEQYMKFHYS